MQYLWNWETSAVATAATTYFHNKAQTQLGKSESTGQKDGMPVSQIKKMQRQSDCVSTREISREMLHYHPKMAKILLNLLVHAVELVGKAHISSSFMTYVKV